MSSIAAIGVGPLEIGIVLLIVLIIFGPKRIPELGRSLGSGMRGFKESVTGKGDDEEPERIEGSTVADATGDDHDRATADPAGTAGEHRN